MLLWRYEFIHSRGRPRRLKPQQNGEKLGRTAYFAARDNARLSVFERVK
jgi:hypothetical protein